MAVKRREVKSKGAKERYKHLNAEFERIARRDKKVFLRDQCKEIEENNRIGKTGDLLGEGKGTQLQYCCPENPMDFQARVHGRTVQKDLHDPDNHDGVITHLEPDILECKVK